ncbi:transglycosylase domain-containing protein [Nocardioides nanhaiensis]|uniref:transglycosylase domain-containing protein n=1 Tax=Nocardioides nanhaiensis TaxID=1476871 RepID=UPI0031F06ECA
MSRPRSERLSAPRVVSHLGVMVVVAAVLGVVVSGLAIPFAGVLGFTARTVASGIDELPQELVTDALPQRTRIVDQRGETIATLYDQNRVNVSLKDVSRPMVQAIVSIEDFRFYQHGALDLKGTLRAFVSNQASDSVVQGGSSITQQLVKLTLIQQADSPEEIAAAQDDSYARKINELRYAIALEQEHSKDWILERYLNTAYFGDGAYGVQAAARNYFDVNAGQLNLRQAAMLAGLVQNPGRFDPTNSPDLATERRNVVLNRMAELGVIEQQRADQLKTRKLGLDQPAKQNGCVTSRVPLFCDYVVSYLKQDRSLGRTPRQREQMLKRGGLTIRTTVDFKYQEAADQAVSDNVFPREQAIGALAVVEPGTGEVKAISQSRPYGADKDAGETFLNYVIPQEIGKANGFQAGSTFKSFTLAAALEDGLPLSTTYNSLSPMTFDQANFETCDYGPDLGGTFPMVNSTSSGLMNMYSGTRLSVNTYFIQLEEEVGICKPFELARAMGVRLTSPNGEGGVQPEMYPNFTLGVADVSPLEMAEAYATFAARGLHCESRPVTQIRDAQGNVLKNYPAQCDQVMEQSTADAVSDVLRGVLEGSGFAAAQALDQPSAGKTGTTNDGNSVWFAGYMPGMAAAAMIAGVTEAGEPDSLLYKTVGGSTVYSASGSGFAAPIWGEAMRVIDDDFEYEDFVYPSGVSGVGNTSVAPPPSPSPPQNTGRGRGRG